MERTRPGAIPAEAPPAQPWFGWRVGRAWAVGAAVALAYYALARLGLLFALPGSLASPVWPPTGLAIAAVALWRTPAALGVLAGAVAAEYAAVGHPGAALAIGLGNTAEALVGGLLLARLGGAAAFRSVGGVGRFVGLAALAPLGSAAIGVAALVLAGVVPPAAAPQVGWTWYLGDVAGAVVVAPVVVLAAQVRWAGLRLRRLAEPAAAAALLLGLAAALFGLVPGVPGNWPGRLLLLMPILAWIATRHSPAFATACLAAVDALAIAATRMGRGPFQVSEPNTAFLQLQSFVLTAAAIVLTLGALRAERRRAEAELERRVEERTAKLAAAQEIAHIGSWEWDVAADRIAWTDELYRIFGVPPRGFAATFQAYLGFVHPEDRATAERTVRQALADHRPFAFDHRVVHPDGTVRSVHSQGRVEVDAAGRPVRMSGTAHDVTERQATDAALREAQRIARLGSWELDPAARTVRASPQMFHLLGLPRTDAPVPFETLWARVPADQLEAAQRRLADSLRTGAPLSLDLRIPAGEGVERWLHVEGRRDAASGRMVGTAQDVTAERQGEAALRESLERFKVLADGSPLGVFHVTPRGQVDYANPRWAQIAGCDHRDLAAIRAAIHPDDLPRLAQEWRAAVASGSDLVSEFRCVHRDGTVVQCAARASPVRDATGAVTGFVGTLDDVTERRAAETREREVAALKEQARFKTEFLRTAAHELGNPLTPIKIQLRMLREFVRRDAHAGARKNVEILDRNVERLHLLVRDMLESARLQSGRMRLLPRPMDLSGMAHEVAETFQETAIDTGVALEVEAPPELPMVADPDRLTQVLYNLLSNAMKFTPPGGRIHVRARRAGGQAEILVQDTGAGFTPEQAAGLFQPFGQVHDAVPGKGGTGLGLYISKGIVEQHGGAVEAASDGPGRGATFTVRLPLVAAPPSEPSPSTGHGREGPWPAQPHGSRGEGATGPHGVPSPGRRP